jgi:hypothetical protein
MNGLDYYLLIIAIIALLVALPGSFKKKQNKSKSHAH